MNDNYHERLATCVTPEEVWKLMRGRIYPRTNNSRFEDPLLLLPNTRNKYISLELPTDLIGLAMRILIYLKLDGKIGNAPRRGGVYDYTCSVRAIFGDIQQIKHIKKPNDIDSETLDKLIRNSVEKGNKVSTTYETKIDRIKGWLSINHRLPFFLRFNVYLFIDSNEYKLLEQQYHEKIRRRYHGLGGNKQPYQLAHMRTIVSEAINYIENYAEDCIIAAKFYTTNKKEKSNNLRERLVVKFFQSDIHVFKEPTLKAMQTYCKKLKSDKFVANPKSRGQASIGSILSAIARLQESCVVTILMVTGMRSQELDMLPRYPVINKSEHHELDSSFNLTRIIYKTAYHDDGEPLTMPIPEIAAVALKYLSELSEFNDGNKTGILNLSSFRHQLNDNSHTRINKLVESHCKRLGIIDIPTSHQFRHSMAFIIAHLNDRDGLELARKFLGHKSIEMTKRYMGHFNDITRKALRYIGEYNPIIANAMHELQQIESFQILDEQIAKEIEKNNPIYGPVAKRITQFQGNITNEFKQVIVKSIRILIETNRLAIIQTPTNFCLHDLTSPEKMACQRGLTHDDFTGIAVHPASCEGASCNCSLFTMQHVETLKEQSKSFIEEYPEELRMRLSKNTYFTNDGLQNPYVNIIKQYNEDIKKRS